MNYKLTNKEYWDNSWKTTKVIRKSNKLIPKSLDKIVFLLKKYIPKTENRMNAIEIGCYPGRYMKFVATLGYIVNGIDFTQDIDNLRKIFLKNNIPIGEIINSDFLIHDFSRKYDLVMSFGFMEHFTNYKEITIKHIELVSDNGYLVITVPNFRIGLMSKIAKKFLPDHCKTHNIASMDPFEWKELIEGYNFEILFCGYFGGPFISYNKELSKKEYIFFQILRVIFKLINILPFIYESKRGILSGHAGIVAKKKF